MTLRRLNVATSMVAAYLFAGGLYVLAAEWPTSFPLSRFLLVLAPAAASVACLIAVRALPPSAAGPWSLLSASALLASLGTILSLAGPATAHVGSVAPLTAFLAGHVAFALALAWMIHQRDIGRSHEILIDGTLMLAIAVALVLHWAPALGSGAGARDPITLAMIVAILVSAGCGVTFAMMLIGSRRSAVIGDSPVAIAGAAALFAVSVLPLAFAVPIPAAGPYAIASIAAWGCLAWSASSAIPRGTGSSAVTRSDPGGRRLRHIVAPVAALAIAVVVLDTSLRAPPRLATAFALAVAAALLALRVSQLLVATWGTSAERLELKQTRALVELSRALSGRAELAEMLDVVTQWACRLLNAHGAVLELVSDDGKLLELRAVTGLPAEAIGLRSPVDGSFTGWVVRNGMPRATTDPRREPDIQDDSRPLLGKSPVVAVPMRYHGRTLGVLACVSTRPFEVGDFVLLGALADQAAVAIENARLFERVVTLSKTDPLTGLYNRRQLELDLTREFAAARRGRKLFAVMFDINGFKEYNDVFGHVAGDEVLRMFGEVLTAETRSMNPPARYGGDEFVALLTDTNIHGAHLFTERVRRQFSLTVAKLRPASLSVAAGFAEFQPEMRGPDELIDAADRALYVSKANRPKTG